MQQVVLHHFAGVEVEYEFKCRTPNIDFNPYLEKISEEIYKLKNLNLTYEEANYLLKLGFLSEDYVDFLRGFCFVPEQYVDIRCDKNDLCINVKGPWLQTTLFEIPILATVNEVYFSDNKNLTGGAIHLAEKSEYLRKHGKDIKIAEFGTRRRYSKKWQIAVLEYLLKENKQNIIGTSNVDLAMRFGITPIGTMAHEYLQAFQQLVPLHVFQKAALDVWAKEYRGRLGIALTDTVGFDAFLKDFDLYFSKLFDGMRHDSGDPLEWGNKALLHYEKMGIDPKTKTLIFSDGLTIPTAIKTYYDFKAYTNTAFGIGTNLTNDVGLEPIQIVMKMIKCNDHPVAKVSDSPGKGMCKSETFLNYLKETFNIK